MGHFATLYKGIGNVVRVYCCGAFICVKMAEFD